MKNFFFGLEKWIKVILIWIVGIFLTVPFVFSQEKKIIVNKLNAKNGLSADIITDLVEGKQGFIWIATSDGMDRFDGKSIKHYKNAFV